MSLRDRIDSKRKMMNEGKSDTASLQPMQKSNLLQDRIEKKRFGMDLQNVSNDIVKLGSDIESAMSTRTDKAQMYNIKNRADSMSSRLNTLWRKATDLGADSSIASYLSQTKRAFDSAMTGWDDLSSLYEQYKTDDAFNAEMKRRSLTEKYKGKSYDEVQKILSLGAKSMPKDEREFLFNYGTNVGWNSLEDYDKNIAEWTKTGKNGQKMERAGIDGLRQARNLFDIEHRADKWIAEAKNDPEYASKTTSLGTSSEEINPGYGKTDAVDLLKFAEFATDDERDAYTYYKSTDPKKAKQMLDDMKIAIDKRYTENMEKNIADYSEAWGGWSVIPNAIGAVAALPFRGMGFVEDVVNTIKGEEINPYSMAHSATNFSNALTEANTKTLDTGSGFNIFGQDIGSFAYNALQSTAESIVGANLFGSMYTPIMGMSAASSKAREMKEQGYGDTDIAISSFISGAIEAACEYLPTERYLTLQKADMYGLRRTLKGILGQAAEEGLEEGVTEILNKTYDAFAHADSNEMSKTYKEYISLGYTEEEARSMVAKKVADDILGAMAGGALSGGIMGVQAKFSSSKAVKNEGREINEVGSVETLMRDADKTLGQITEENLKDGEFKSLSKYVDLYNRAKSGETLSDADTGHLLEGIKEAAEALGTDEARKAANDAYNYARDPERKVAEEAYKEAEKTRREELGEKVFQDTYEGVGKASDEYLRAKYNDDIADDFESVLETHKGKIDSESLMRAYTTAIEYGENGLFDEYDAIQATNNILTESESKKAFLEGYKHGQAQLQKVSAEVDAKIKSANLETTKYAQGKFDTEEIKGEKLTKYQKKNLQILKGLSKLGINVEVFASKVDENGKRKGENGSFNKNTNTIRIDIYSGLSDNSEALDNAIMSTVSHELTHWAEGKASELYKALSKSVFSILEDADGMNFEKRIDAEIKFHKAEFGRELSVKDAQSEVIARACEDCLVNSEKMYDMLVKLGDDSLRRRFTEALRKTAKKIIDLFGDIKGMMSLGETATTVRNAGKMEDVTKMWEDMLEKAIKANQAEMQSEAKEAKVGAEKIANDVVNLNENNLLQYRAIEEDYEEYKAMLLKHGILTKAEFDELFETIDEAIKIVKANLEVLDYGWDTDINDRVFNPIKQNSDKLYKVSNDFSTLCRKRILQQVVQTHLQEALDKELTTEEAIVIRDELIKIREEGRDIEVACALCYVEAARMKSNKQIQTFLNDKYSVMKDFFAWNDEETGWKMEEAEDATRKELSEKYGDEKILTMSLTDIEHKYGKKEATRIRDAKRAIRDNYKLSEAQLSIVDDANKLSIKDFTTPKGLENLARNHSEIFDAYTTFVRNATKSKGIENDTFWRVGDSLAISDGRIKAMNNENGLRTQSWSDFQVIHLLDYIASTIELSTRKAKMQGYTKVPDYVELMGLTSLMINMSLIPKAEYIGALEYDSIEGMDYIKALELRRKYPNTAATICIGINNEQISLLLADNTIDYVIPYHRSGMSKAIKKLMHIPSWTSYEDKQNEKKFKTVEEATRNAQNYGVKLDMSNYQKNIKFSDWYDYNSAKSEADKLLSNLPENASEDEKFACGCAAMQKMADRYLLVCAERGFAPKFEAFKNEDNYWKLLIDRKMVNQITGEIIEQKAVVPIFKKSEVLRILDEELERYPHVKADQEYATRKVVKKFLSGELNKRLSRETAKVIKDNVNALAEYNIIKSTEDEQLTTDENSLHQYRENVSPRQLLLNAEVNADNETESRLLTEYKWDAQVVENSMTRLDEIREALKTEKDTTKISALHVEQRTLERRVINYNRQLDKLEGTATLMKVYDRETVANVKRKSELAQSAAYQRAQEKAFELIAKRNEELYKKKYNMLSAKEKELKREMYKQMFDVQKSREEQARLRSKNAKELAKVKSSFEDKIAEIKRENNHRNAERRNETERKKYFESILKTAKQMGIMLKANSVEKHVPKVMREAIADLIKALDFTSRRGLGDLEGQKNNGVPYKKDIRISDAMQNFVNAVGNASATAKGVYDESYNIKSATEKVENDFVNMFMLLPEGTKEDLDNIVAKIRRFEAMETDGMLVLNRLTAAETKYVAQTMKAVLTTINNANRLYKNAAFEGVRELGKSDIIELTAKEIENRKPDGAITRFLGWKNLQPIRAFERISTGARSIFGELQRGFSTFAFRANDVVDFANNTFTGNEAKKWTNDTIDVMDYNGKTFKMSVAQAMSLYCLSKREQAQGHIYGYGVVVGQYGKGRKTVEDAKSHNMTIDGIVKLAQDLNKYNPKTLEVADALQNFMSTTCSEWGNEVSMARFGYEAFGEKNYFPIRVYDEHGTVTDSDETSLFRLLNASFAKPLTEHANNAIYVDNIFDVFAQHSTEMAKYNALAMPVLDAFKWLNYIEKEDLGEGTLKTATSVRQAMRGAFGDEASKYVLNLIRDINGAGQSVRDEGGLKKLMSNVKRASVGANISVALLQPTSYFRAKAVIPYKYLALGLTNGHPRRAFKRACEYSGIAKYKALGFYDINASRSITSMITRDDTLLDKIGEISMKGAEMGDELTWGCLWSACEAKINAENRNITHGSDEYYARVAEIFDEIIYKTQVIDTVLTRSQVMRDKSIGWQTYTAFMSEPTVSYNMFAAEVLDFNDTKKLHGVKFAAKKVAKPMLNATIAHLVTSAASAIVRGFVNGLRNYDPDEDEDGSKLEELWKAYISEVTIEVPILKEVIEMMQGYTPRNLTLQGFQDAYYAYNDVKKLIDGKDVKFSKVFNDFAKAISELSGVPGYGFLRDLKATWNATYAKYIDKDAYIE